MNIKNIIFRKEDKKDYKAVENLTREAFWNWFVPGCDEHYLAHILRDADCFINDLDIVAELDGEVIANIMYTKAIIIGDDGNNYPVIMFGPLSVHPKYQGMGVGGRIIEHSKALAKDLGYMAILIYGDPEYYNRVGFLPAENYGIGTASNTYTPALQACELIDGALDGCSGRFIEDDVFDIKQDDVKEFDKSFEIKEKIEGIKMQYRFKHLNSISKPR